MLSIRFSGPIVSAVVAEVNRLDQHPDFHQEGAAYKAAWDRAGSSAMKHAEAFRRDCLLASLIAHPARPPLIWLTAQRTALLDAQLAMQPARERRAA